MITGRPDFITKRNPASAEDTDWADAAVMKSPSQDGKLILYTCPFCKKYMTVPAATMETKAPNEHRRVRRKVAAHIRMTHERSE